MRIVTAVLDIEGTKLPAELVGLESFRQALILFRLRERPVGQALLNVANGRIGTFKLHETVKDDAGGTLLEQRVRDYLKWDETRMVNSAGRCFHRKILAIPGTTPMGLGRCGLCTYMVLHRNWKTRKVLRHWLMDLLLFPQNVKRRHEIS